MFPVKNMEQCGVKLDIIPLHLQLDHFNSISHMIVHAKVTAGWWGRLCVFLCLCLVRAGHRTALRGKRVEGGMTVIVMRCRTLWKGDQHRWHMAGEVEGGIFYKGKQRKGTKNTEQRKPWKKHPVPFHSVFFWCFGTFCDKMFEKVCVVSPGCTQEVSGACCQGKPAPLPGQSQNTSKSSTGLQGHRWL